MEKESNKGMHFNAPPTRFGFARANRKAATEAEAILWNALKNKQLGGFKFRRQHPLGNFILDFYCHEARLGIEVDGDYHLKPVQAEYDELRAEAIQSEGGVQILRFSNDAIFHGLADVLDSIFVALNQEK
jgi:very-short-patch-repair endonuclease